RPRHRAGVRRRAVRAARASAARDRRPVPRRSPRGTRLGGSDAHVRLPAGAQAGDRPSVGARTPAAGRSATGAARRMRRDEIVPRLLVAALVIGVVVVLLIEGGSVGPNSPPVPSTLAPPPASTTSTSPSPAPAPGRVQFGAN